ncbi:unnamed protein product [Hyaloperonospora brassicae]|uniref:Uncharacterized protein n=1 Tax=Hyaloperonospora brassicae TaxID=162125 RepID=A0AAV0T501_HYABA|nr:unnamed protein product [Hyaloperonospora brassicae]
MTDSRTHLSVRAFEFDVEEPEEEDTHRNDYISDADRGTVVKPLLLREAVVADAGVSMHYPTTAGSGLPTDPDVVFGMSHSHLLAPAPICSTVVGSDPGPSVAKSVMTALLAGSPQRLSTSDVHGRVKSPLAYGTDVSTPQRHSILRMNAGYRENSRHILKKSASVEFAMNYDHEQVAPSIHASAPFIGREPRRLTFEEKAELYRVRPDLEIGVAPFCTESADEVNRRNQRRVVFSIFGGMISIIILLVFVSMWDQNK